MMFFLITGMPTQSYDNLRGSHDAPCIGERAPMGGGGGGSWFPCVGAREPGVVAREALDANPPVSPGWPKGGGG